MEKKEIKFRVWDKLSKKMFEWDDVKNWDFATVEWDMYHHLQYTSLKDKNGKEIYEGDIQDYGHGRILVVEFENGSFGLRMPGGNFEKTWISPSHFEIIGNIYENPELLTPNPTL